jgi:hypothetical protein
VFFDVAQRVVESEVRCHRDLGRPQPFFSLSDGIDDTGEGSGGDGAEKAATEVGSGRGRSWPGGGEVATRRRREGADPAGLTRLAGGG